MSISIYIIIAGVTGFILGAGIIYLFLSSIIKKYKNQSLTDELTGLYNSRELKKRLSLETERSKRYKLPFSILLIDVDKFKEINDIYGYKTADRVLCDLVERIQKQLRKSDLLFRYKFGDEFIIMALNTDEKGANILAERIKKNISEQKFLLTKDKKEKQITISIGISEFEISKPEKEIEKEAEENLKIIKSSKMSIDN